MCRDAGSIPGQGTKIPHAELSNLWCRELWKEGKISTYFIQTFVQLSPAQMCILRSPPNKYSLPLWVLLPALFFFIESIGRAPTLSPESVIRWICLLNNCILLIKYHLSPVCVWSDPYHKSFITLIHSLIFRLNWPHFSLLYKVAAFPLETKSQLFKYVLSLRLLSWLLNIFLLCLQDFSSLFQVIQAAPTTEVATSPMWLLKLKLINIK